MPPFSPETSVSAHFYGLQDAVFEIGIHEPAAASPAIPEVVIQDVWSMQHFDRSGLRTTDGQAVTVVHPGEPNAHGGPDFRMSRLKLDGQTWCGDVEIHQASAGWVQHRHEHDARYNSVILHVVLEADLLTGKLVREDGSRLPELVLQSYLTHPVRSLVYQFYAQPPGGIACSRQWASTPPDLRNRWIGQLGRERLGSKQARLAETYLHTPDLDQLLYELLMAGLGYVPNTDAMAALARRVPLSLVRTIEDGLDVEALLLGTAGLLPTPEKLLQANRETADYVMDLRDRYTWLARRYRVAAMPEAAWQYFRLRPANFPPLRIGQAAALLRGDPPGLLRREPVRLLAEAAASADAISKLRRLLSPEPSPFWGNHVRLDRATKPHVASLGRQRADTLIVNAVAPVLLLHAEQSASQSLEEAVFQVLENMPPEQDEVGRTFAALGTRPRHALAAQGLHQLYRTRCAAARCLTCDIGRHVLGLNGPGGEG